MIPASFTKGLSLGREDSRIVACLLADKPLPRNLPRGPEDMYSAPEDEDSSETEDSSSSNVSG